MGRTGLATGGEGGGDGDANFGDTSQEPTLAAAADHAREHSLTRTDAGGWEEGGEDAVGGGGGGSEVDVADAALALRAFALPETESASGAGEMARGEAGPGMTVSDAMELDAEEV